MSDRIIKVNELERELILELAADLDAHLVCQGGVDSSGRQSRTRDVRLARRVIARNRNDLVWHHRNGSTGYSVR